MSDNNLNKILDIILRNKYNRMDLDNLENDVLSKLSAIKKDQELSWYEKIIISFSAPQFRIASISIAIILGAIASPFFSIETSTYPDKNILVKNIFSSNSTYLPINLIERTK